MPLIVYIKFILSSVHTTKEEFEHTAIFLRLHLPCTQRGRTNLSRKRSFSKALFERKMIFLRSIVDGKHFDNGALDAFQGENSFQMEQCKALTGDREQNANGG